MTARLVSPEAEATAARLWRDRWTVAEIAKALDVSVGRFSHFLQSNRDRFPARQASKTPIPGRPLVADAGFIPPARRFECLGDALIARSPGCSWPCEDSEGVWFCGEGRTAVVVAGELRLKSYCALHYRQSVQRRAA